MKTSTKINRLKPGHYWAVIDNRGKQIWGSTIRRECLRVQKGTSFRLVQLPKQ